MKIARQVGSGVKGHQRCKGSAAIGRYHHLYFVIGAKFTCITGEIISQCGIEGHARGGCSHEFRADDPLAIGIVVQLDTCRGIAGGSEIRFIFPV